MSELTDMPLYFLAKPQTVASFETDAFRTAVEDHLSNLKNQSSTQTLQCLPIDAEVYRGDLFGLLSKMGIEHRLRWTTMRMNGYTSPQDYDGEKVIFLIPNIDSMDRLASTVAARRGLQV